MDDWERERIRHHRICRYTLAIVASAGILFLIFWFGGSIEGTTVTQTRETATAAPENLTSNQGAQGTHPKSSAKLSDGANVCLPMAMVVKGTWGPDKCTGKDLTRLPKPSDMHWDVESLDGKAVFAKIRVRPDLRHHNATKAYSLEHATNGKVNMTAIVVPVEAQHEDKIYESSTSGISTKFFEMKFGYGDEFGYIARIQEADNSHGGVTVSFQIISQYGEHAKTVFKSDLFSEKFELMDEKEVHQQITLFIRPATGWVAGGCKDTWIIDVKDPLSVHPKVAALLSVYLSHRQSELLEAIREVKERHDGKRPQDYRPAGTKDAKIGGSVESNSTTLGDLTGGRNNGTIVGINGRPVNTTDNDGKHGKGNGGGNFVTDAVGMPKNGMKPEANDVVHVPCDAKPIDKDKAAAVLLNAQQGGKNKKEVTAATKKASAVLRANTEKKETKVVAHEKAKAKEDESTHEAAGPILDSPFKLK
eukprot:GFYU01003989.1.p1 GENE.GFYU01003989.1~~GFYU01003989.1.p1  ORF type:complete len:476 (-),score=137.41 GFYU01003989.1:320-1747(-)